MSLALRRFHLDGIGPPGARFDPLTVDLGAAEAERAARAAVLFLENGGGKSVLLRLLFSVVLPGRRHTVGAVKLDGYVGGRDTGHVVLEWQTADGPLITGTLFEWRNRTRSATSSNLRQSWYSFKPRAGVLTLDELPTREGERRVSRAGFFERLNALAREHPDLELVTEPDSPGRWADHLLRSTPLDPEIFRYQRQMNADEADAESLFSGVKTDEDFVRFVVEAVQDPEELEDFGGLLVDYSSQLDQRSHREVEARFCIEGAAALRPLGEAHAAVEEARAQETSAQGAVDRLRAQLRAAADRAEDDARTLTKEAEAARARVADLRQESRQSEDVANELSWREAQFRHQAAKDAHDRAQAAVAEAKLIADAWGQVGLVIEQRHLSAQLGELRTAQERQQHELAPLREAMERAARRYAARLLAEAEQLELQAAAEGQAAEAHDRQATEQAGEHDARQREAGQAAERAQSLREREAEVARAVETVREEGLLQPGEKVASGLERARRSAEQLSVEYDQLRARTTELTQQREERQSRLHAAQTTLVQADGQLTAFRRELDGYLADAQAIIDRPRTQEIAPDAEDAWLVCDRLEEVLSEAVRSGEATERSLRDAIDRLDQRLEQLGTDGLLPAAPEVQAVLEAVWAAGIGAATGWSYLDQNLDADGRAQALTTNPALAGGVIVTDPAQVGAAVEAVASAGIETESVVLVGAAGDLQQPGAGRSAPVRAALYDREWTARVREELEVERATSREALDDLLIRLGVDHPLLAEVRDLQRRCSPGHRGHLTSEVGRLSEEVRAGRERVAELEEELSLLAGELSSLTEQEPSARERADRARDEHRRLDALAADEAKAQGWSAEAQDADRRQQALTEEVERLSTAAAEARQEAENARTRQRRARADAASRRGDAQQLNVPEASDRELGFATGVEENGANEEDPDGPDSGTAAVTLSTSELRGAYDAAHEAYETERAGRDLTDQIERVEERLASRNSQLAEVDGQVSAQARTLAGQPGAEDPGARLERLAEAREALVLAESRRSESATTLGEAQQLLRQREPKGKRRHAELAEPAEPADADSAAQAAADHLRHAGELSQKARDADQVASDRDTQAETARHRAELLGVTLTMLPATEAGPTEDEGEDDRPEGHQALVTPWQGSPEQANDAAQAARERLDNAAQAVTDAARQLDKADNKVRSVASDPELARMGGLRVALANEPTDHLASRALALADELDTMRRSVEEELADLRRHREGIVQRLATLVEAQLRQLKLLSRLSTMPEGLGEWSGKPFVSIGFEQVSAGELTARLAPIVDEAAAEPRKRKATDLMLAGMRAAVAQARGDGEKTFTVKLLRPNRMMAYQRATVAELEGEFSGGMKLTAAICTYCSLAALRANVRSVGNLFGADPGPLFLDNPLGKASADYLLELQHAIAGKLGVQLVHTTGVWDVEALASYERVVRLRNLADLRRNLSRLRVDDAVELPGEGAAIDAVSFAVRAGAGDSAVADDSEV